MNINIGQLTINDKVNWTGSDTTINEQTRRWNSIQNRAIDETTSSPEIPLNSENKNDPVLCILSTALLSRRVNIDKETIKKIESLRGVSLHTLTENFLGWSH